MEDLQVKVKSKQCEKESTDALKEEGTSVVKPRQTDAATVNKPFILAGTTVSIRLWVRCYETSF